MIHGRAFIWLCLVVVAAGCSRPAAPAWTEYRDARTGFVIRLPGGWERVAQTGEAEVRFVPAGAPAGSAEFISIFIVPSPNGASEPELRRAVFSLLPIHGVSGFQRDGRTTAEMLWFKFEVTGSTAGAEWASVGVAVGGRARTAVAVCAKPLSAWRAGQSQCDEVMRSFRPGDLGR